MQDPAVVRAEDLPKYRGYLVRHPAPPELAIDPRPFKFDQLRYTPSLVYRNSEARKRQEEV